MQNISLFGRRIVAPILQNPKTINPLYHVNYICPTFNRQNSNSASVTRIRRGMFPKHYKTLLCLQDGSTVTIRCKEPLKILVVPDDLKSMDTSEKTERFAKRKKKEEVVIADEFEDDFDFGKYVR
jgi:large subunit ribosomal protein L55